MSDERERDAKRLEEIEGGILKVNQRIILANACREQLRRERDAIWSKYHQSGYPIRSCGLKAIS